MATTLAESIPKRLWDYTLLAPADRPIYSNTPRAPRLATSVALRGGAVDLLLAVVRRVPVADTDIAIFGDAAIWQNWLEKTPF